MAFIASTTARGLVLTSGGGILTLAALFGAAACARHDPPSPSVGHNAGVLLVDAAPPKAPVAKAGDDARAAAGSPPAGSSLAWPESVRLERWDEAWIGLEALSADEKSKPEIRYVRGRAALARGDHATAAALLEDLEKALPLVSEDIARHRAEAKLRAGPFDQAGDFFLSRQGAASQLKAAEAFEKAKDPRVRVAIDRVVTNERRTRGQETLARSIRMRLGNGDAQAREDARWIVVHAQSPAESKDAEALLAKTDAAHPLSGDEWMTRGRALTDGGFTNDAIAAFDHAGTAAGTKVTLLDRMRAKGDALYRAGARYTEAAAKLNECSAVGGPHAAEDAFRAARALSRADQDDQAIQAYATVARRFPRTTWSDQASFQSAKLHILHGRWREAATAFDEYVRHYPSGAERHDAARNRAIAHLMAGDHREARKLFEELASDDPDPTGSARALTMAALASARDGDRTHAVARWTEVARTRPLSWPALVARTRLAEFNAPIPPTIEPPESGAAPEPLLVKLPPPVDMLHRIGLDGDAEDALRERENVVTGSAFGRGLEALCSAYGQLGRARRRYQVAQQVPKEMLATAPGLRTRWAWECAYPMPYESHVAARESTDKLPEGLIYAVMRQESGFDPNVVSPARAVGLLQLMPATAKVVAEGASLSHDDARLTSPPYNIALGSMYLHELLDKFHGVIPYAVAGYNGGPDAIARWASRSPGMDLDVFVERIPYAETRGYVSRVMGNLARYGYMREGEAGVPKVKLIL